MRVDRKLGFVLLVVVCLVLVGCGSNTNQSIPVDFKKGTAGLQLTLLDNTPPRQVFQDSKFKVIAKLDNQAAYEINNPQVSIVGLDERFFTISPQSKNLETMQGRSVTSPKGDTLFVEFTGQSKKLFSSAEKYIGHYFIKGQFTSKFEFIDTVCINTNLYDTYDSGCKVQTSKSYSGQGAPVAVTKVEEIIFPGQGAGVEFRLTVKNRGKGKIKRLTVGTSTLGGKPLSCRYKGLSVEQRTFVPKKEDKEIQIVCQKAAETLNSYQTTLNLDFSYDYTFEQKHTLTMVK